MNNILSSVFKVNKVVELDGNSGDTLLKGKDKRRG